LSGAGSGAGLVGAPLKLTTVLFGSPALATTKPAPAVTSLLTAG
jgi:hypothetical protein